MRQALRLHPASICSASIHVEVAVERPHPDRLALCYFVVGDISHLKIPPLAAAARADGLWRHTCFEAFVRAPPDIGYYEFNFAPSAQWAAYRFGGYRSEMRVAAEIGAPRFEVQSSPEQYTLRASLELPLLSTLPRGVGWRLGLSAVIEETNGNISYWALAHPPGKADFHHPDCFANEIYPT